MDVDEHERLCNLMPRHKSK